MSTMKRLLFVVAGLALVVVSLALSQRDAASSYASSASSDLVQGDGAAVGSILPLYETVMGYIIASAEQVPEETLGYRPTPEVRTFGEIVGHVAMSQYWFCNGATGQDEQPGNFEELTDKASLLEAIKTAHEYCGEAYAMADDMAMEELELWGETGTRLWVLSYNMAHAWEHYGNLVTYMRANGMVPPSSQGGM